MQDLDASHEFGTGYFNDALNVFRYHALLWSGTAESVVDLNPTGFTESRGMALAENRQVGQGRSPTATGNLFHALLWQGSANSYVGLNPTGFNASIANGI